MDTHQLQQDFFAKVDWHGTFGPLLDLLPDVGFFMKDREGRFVMHPFTGGSKQIGMGSSPAQSEFIRRAFVD
jgi:hypothetical protein